MRIHLAADHAGYQLGRALEASLSASGHDVLWHGAAAYDEGDDYPPFAIAVAHAVIEDEDAGVEARGVVVGATGAGENIAANKVNGARAVTGLSIDFVTAARLRVDANIVTLGVDFVDEALATSLVATLVDAPFGVETGDVRRIMNTAEYENAGTIEGWNAQEFDNIAD
ncbi:ribose 5-phosphate isomerase B [Homoserinimonas aerilata]|uniref:Ribose 5-phosphate isomerase B n=1 Tax=Homoserinimonas aerilata TaxID=1162970 RepID=A0A542YK24_9MICO|nr:RpiB/LacA/LacB family sugar-phosphate isomerase [Homoserinimonas aerilata]TQL48411.1 ribose 5-phosphate isomerase B [Homoserinimonas aerilata]